MLQTVAEHIVGVLRHERLPGAVRVVHPRERLARLSSTFFGRTLEDDFGDSDDYVVVAPAVCGHMAAAATPWLKLWLAYLQTHFGSPPSPFWLALASPASRVAPTSRCSTEGKEVILPTDDAHVDIFNDILDYPAIGRALESPQPWPCPLGSVAPPLAEGGAHVRVQRTHPQTHGRGARPAHVAYVLRARAFRRLAARYSR